MPILLQKPDFQFLPIERLVDNELELVAPAESYVDEVLDAAHHPRTRRDMPHEAAITRDQIQDMLTQWPLGHQSPDAAKGIVPAYHFWMRLPHSGPVVAGAIALRISNDSHTCLYYGHIGYHVYPQHRGHHYAARACQLLLPLAKRHGLSTLWITCNPDNFPSRRTCERINAQLIETIDVPHGHPLYLRGEKQKCRYRVSI